MAANLAAARTTPVGIVVSLWPPVCLTGALELVALVASPANKQPIVTNATPAERAANAPVDAWFRSVDGEVMDCCGRPDESWLATVSTPGWAQQCAAPGW